MKFKPVDLILKKLTILFGHSNLEIQEEVSLQKDMVIPMEEILETENILSTNLLRKCSEKSIIIINIIILIFINLDL
jgi:hypothetical protein